MGLEMRIDAVKSVSERCIGFLPLACPAAIDHYAEDVFDSAKMFEYLPKGTVRKLLATINGGQPLDSSIADDVAHAMKEWAVSRGATHYTHWFQPLTGGTAEKHDAFLEFSGGKAIFDFSGKNLVVGEPDASSFPSGGLRCTFEARGYTAWDPTSPAFIKRHSNGATLCIPTVFCSYTGEVLDKKTPLLRSVQAMKHAVTRLMRCFHEPEETFNITLGPEQEYFLIDKKFYLSRPDLVQTGRTLFGAPPPKHQQLEDHYFGSIRLRILDFMTQVEEELWKLGIPAKTRHNEVAPAQFELAPIYENINLAVDHNMLVMEVLRQVAERNGLVCLLHEKPFAGINGSGKHNNWAVAYGKRNLLDPGSSPRDNAVFLTVLSAIIRAIDLHSDILRVATSGAGNDHRLGANEAPPAIISIFLGEQLADVIDQIVDGNTAAKSKKPDSMRVGVDSIPPLPMDTTDRNRTSPFAFTGNKFEFRAPGSSQSCADVNTILNTIIAESLDYISGKLEALPADKFNAGLQTVLKTVISEHRRIIFNGDNYSAGWLEEAARRGLPNLPTTMDAIKPLLKPENQAIFEKYGVFNSAELKSRYEVYMEEYHSKIRIEGGIALEMAQSMIMPAVVSEYSRVVPALGVGERGTTIPGAKSLANYAARLGNGLDRLEACCTALDKALSGKHEGIILAMNDLREVVDGLEHIVSDSAWPLPKYREMLFIY